jgi:MHS family proline/betaine transporter-like MFS transporter
LQPTSAARERAEAEGRITGFSQRRLIAAGLIGNVLEWYDFSIYGYFASSIGRHFFPSHDPSISLIAAFGVFSAGFLTRPLGAILFGYIADRHNRERALMLSIMAMAVPTFLTGLMPGYRRIGIAAPILMVMLRLTQGLSAGGEYTTSIVFLAERSVHRRRGLTASVGLFGSIAGGMLGSAVGAILSLAMSAEQLGAWGWRIPFLSGIVLAMVGVLIRRALQHGDLPARSGVTIRRVLMTQWFAVLRVIGFEILEAVGFYTTFIYLATYLADVIHMPAREAFLINVLSMGFVLTVIPVAGMFSDRFGRKPVLLTAAACGTLFAWPLFRLFQHASFGFALAGQMGLAAIVGCYEGATPAAVAESFPAAVRGTGVGLAFNLCMTLFGGTTPVVATFLIARTQSPMAPAVYLMCAAACSGLVVLTLPERFRAALDDL